MWFIQILLSNGKKLTDEHTCWRKNFQGCDILSK